jgi:uncharacterized protein YktA (UPF0223 family)
MEYPYPFSIDWKTDEVIDVISFFQAIEEAYASGINKDELMKRYRRFKEIVPGKADEKNICDEFEDNSGFSSYLVIKQAKNAEVEGKIKMKKGSK